MKSKTIKFNLAFVIFLLASFSLFAQNVPNERRVYYLDATYSMVSNKLWEPCKENLIKAIQNIDDSNTEVVVVVFADNVNAKDKVWKKWEQKATDQGKDILEKNIKGLPMPLKSTMTNLYDPWNDFYCEVKKDKVNYMFLMTDGGHEQGGDFFGTIDKWKSKTDALTYGFFVELTENVGSREVKARDTARQHIDAQKERLWRVSSADVNLNLVRLGNEATYNVRNDGYIDVPVYLSGKDKSIIRDISFSCEGIDGFSLGKTEVSDGCIRLFINNNADVSTYDESSNFKINASLKENDDKSILLTNTINVSCINKKERSLHLSETKLSGKMSHYDSFGFVKQKDVPFETTIKLDWSQDAIGDEATFAEFVVTDKDGKILSTSDVEFSADDGNTRNNFSVNPKQKELHLVVSFPEGTKPGNHQGYLRLQNCKLDRFGNDVVSGNQPAQIEWRIKYDCKWNPLKLGLWGFAVILFAAFLLWMLWLKERVFPTFKNIQKTFMIPDAAPLIINFKGAREVVVAKSRPKKQSGWNRFWKGKTLYKVHPAIESPITFSPAAKRKKIFAKFETGTYRVSPNPIPGVGEANIIDVRRNRTINVN